MISRVNSCVGAFTITDIYESSIFGVAMGFRKWEGYETEWATWIYNPKEKEEYYSGHYNMTLEEAKKDFMYRTQYYCFTAVE